MRFSTSGLTSRRSAAVLALGIALFVLLLLSWHGASASADPYPPTNPSSSSGFEATSGHRVPSSGSSSVATTSNHRDEGLSSTGFQTVAATIIALALLGSGAIFLGLGRRRRHS
ncbi:MAG: hypothetical protein JWO15_3802 [Sphingomonadales bacterium]|nr:hypothetical protein [Sphingomonadales bacterium]